MTVSLNGSEILQTARLLLGILPVDALRRDDLSFALKIEAENSPRGTISRHPSGRFTVSYRPGLNQTLDIRLYDNQRRYVPRRLSIPLVTLSQILSTEQNQPLDYLSSRVKYPLMYPGAAYPISPRSTGLRGRVVSAGQPIRWALVELRTASSAIVLARARGDDRGEFLLVIPPSAVPDVTLIETVSFSLTIYARAVPLQISNLAQIDPFWDLPLESVVDSAADDPVTAGREIPPEYVASQDIVLVDFQLSQMISSHQVSDIEFNPP